MASVNHPEPPQHYFCAEMLLFSFTALRRIDLNNVGVVSKSKYLNISEISAQLDVTVDMIVIQINWAFKAAFISNLKKASCSNKATEIYQ